MLNSFKIKYNAYLSMERHNVKLILKSIDHSQTVHEFQTPVIGDHGHYDQITALKALIGIHKESILSSSLTKDSACESMTELNWYISIPKPNSEIDDSSTIDTHPFTSEIYEIVSSLNAIQINIGYDTDIISLYATELLNNDPSLKLVKTDTILGICIHPSQGLICSSMVKEFKLCQGEHEYCYQTGNLGQFNIMRKG